MKTFVLALWTWSALCAGCVIEKDDGIAINDPTHLPPCMPAFHAGDALTVKLGASYDAQSDYFWDGSIDPSIAYVQGHRTCAGVDGLQTGGLVTFTLKQLNQGFDTTCNPWLADFQPEVLPSAADAQVPDIVGVTVAASFARGPIDGRPTTAIRGLFTPSMNPNGALEPRKLPPLVVTRELTWESGDAIFCYDAWVATWEPAP